MPAANRFRLGRRGQGAIVVAATFGVLARQFTTPESTLHTLGTLLTVLWLPITIYVFIKLSDWFFKGRKGPRNFAPDTPSVHHLRIEATFRTEVPFERGADDSHLQCLLLLDSQAFTVRLLRPLGALPPAGEPTLVDVQFLRPWVALPRFPPGTAFHIVVGREAVGAGKALAVIAPA